MSQNRIGSRRNIGLFLGVFAAATFGLIPLFTLPMLAAGVTVETALCYRFTIAALVMGPILAMRGESFAVRPLDLLKLFGLSLFYLGAVLLFFYAFNLIPSGLCATLQYLYPVAVMLIMILFFHERFYWHIALSLVLAIAGVALLALGPDVEPSLEPGAPAFHAAGISAVFLGVTMALLSGFANALYYVGIQVAKINKINGLVMTFYVMVFGSLICFANALGAGTLHWISGPREIFLAFMLAIGTAVISNLALIISIQRIGSTLAAVVGVIEPVTAVTVGVLVFGEPFNFLICTGICLVIGAVMLVILWPKK